MHFDLFMRQCIIGKCIFFSELLTDQVTQYNKNENDKIERALTPSLDQTPTRRQRILINQFVLKSVPNTKNKWMWFQRQLNKQSTVMLECFNCIPPKYVCGCPQALGNWFGLYNWWTQFLTNYASQRCKDFVGFFVGEVS